MRGIAMTIDSHTHAWGPDTGQHPWETEPIVKAVRALPVETVYTAEELLSDMDEVGVDEAFVVGFPVTAWRDNWYVERIAEEYDRLYGIALVDPFADDAAGELRRLVAVDDLVGIRLATVFPRDAMYEVDPGETVRTDWLRDTLDEAEFWQACVETDAAVTLLSHYEQVEQIRELVDAYPDLTVVVDHFGRADAGVGTDDEALAEFADLPDSVLVKASAIPALSNEPFPHLDMEGRTGWLLDEIGRERVAWGSDYPYVSSVSDYERTLTCLDHMESLSTADRRWLTERSFARHLGV
jgi:predicted TIM-barrel fold metal-dependent hydrolase